MRGLGEELHRRGHTVLGVRLAGHGRTVEDLERTGWLDWYRDAADGCSRLVNESGHIVAIALSMGALLALRLAHERPQAICGLVLMAPAITLRDWRVRWALPIIARVPWLRDRFRFIPKQVGSDIHDDEARRIHPGNRAVPLASTLSLLDLQRRVRADLGAITQPSLLIQGALDHTCPPSNVALLSRELGSAPQEVLILPESGHVVTVDRERDRVVAAVTKFVAGLG
jgi:carboxylesterase